MKAASLTPSKEILLKKVIFCPEQSGRYRNNPNSSDSLILYYFKYKDGNSVLYTKGTACGLTYNHRSKLVKGMGEVLWKQPTAYGGEIKRELVYSKKGNKIWGEKFLLNTDNNTQKFSVAILPNPSSESIKISSNSSLSEFILYDIIGNQVMYKSLDQDLTTIDVSKLQRGIYIYKIAASEKSSQSGKLILK